MDTENFDCIGRVVKVPDPDTKNRSHTILRVVSKEDLVERCIATGVPETKTNVDNIGEFYKTTANPALNEGFFARFVVLVEGDTEELALPIYLEKLGLDCDLCGISTISVRGKNQIPKYWRLFGAFGIPVAVVVDNDAGGDDNKDRSNQQLADCFGVETAKLLKRVKICKKVVSGSEPTTPLLVLEGDFEKALRKDFATDDEAEQLDTWEKKARELIRPVGYQNKGQIARYVARRICEETSFVPKVAKAPFDVFESAGVCR